MENLDVYIYTFVVVVFFMSFGISTFAEFKRMDTTQYTGQERSNDRKVFNNFLAKLFG